MSVGHKFNRIFTKDRYFPEGAIIARPKEFKGMEIGLFPSTRADSKPSAIVYTGKSSKPVIYSSFNSNESREKAIEKVMEGLRASAKAKAERQARRVLTENPVKIGDIFVCSWGYDQTNVDFYQIIEVSGAMVKMQKIAGERVTPEGSRMASDVVAKKDAFIETEPILKKKLQTYDNGKTVSISMNSYSSAYPWNGKPMYESYYA